MLERFSDEARTAVDLAQAEARRLGHDRVGTEHLLLGILTESHSRAARALTAVGVTPSTCRQKVVEAVGHTAPAKRDGDLELTERAGRSLQRAVRLANRQTQDHVEPEHILLSVIQVEGRAGQVLRGLGVDPARVRAAVAEIDGAVDGSTDPAVQAQTLTVPGPGSSSAVPPADTASAPPGSRTGRSGRGGRAGRASAPDGPPPASRSEGVPAPVCPDCGVALDGSLAHRGLVSKGESGDLRAVAIFYCSACGSAIGVANA